MSKLQEKPSALRREHPALQKFKFINFFLCLWVIFALLDPYPDCESGYGPRDPLTHQDPILIQIHNTAGKKASEIRILGPRSGC
jgi:hypothetical protein